MNPRTLEEMLAPLELAVASDRSRAAEAVRLAASCDQVAPRLPLVRRVRNVNPKTGWSWVSAVAHHVLQPTEPATDLETEIGIAQSVYFFVGCCAYPAGDVAILCRSTPPGGESSFWPFDTGGLVSGKVGPTNWTREARKECLLEHWGGGEYLVRFTASFLAAHFGDPLDYVTASQTGAPRFPPYHGLGTGDGDRRAWSVEVQAHSPVALAPAAGLVYKIVVDRPALLAELPDDLIPYAVVAPDLERRVRELVVHCCEGGAA